jgi:hypothetical protein
MRTRGKVPRIHCNHHIHEEDLGQEVNRPQQRNLVGERPLPAAQEEHHRDGAQEEGVQELRQEEHGKTHAGILDVEAGNQLRLRFEQVEGRLFTLGQRRR